MDNIILIENLTKEYKIYNRKIDRLTELCFLIKKHTVFSAIKKFNLEIKKGEIIGILGENGAGKSTLLKLITGVSYPTTGNIKVRGKISSLLELGTVFNLELTGIENIYLHGQIMGFTKKEIDKKKNEIIEFAEIGEYIYQPVKTYSSGMFARLAFACAITVEPDILIVDEILSVGDASFQLKCFKKFEEFKRKNKTILFVTHNINEIIKNCTRVLILENGKKIFDGDVKTGVDEYKRILTKSNLNDSNNSYDILWKNHFMENRHLLSYGNAKAEIIDYGIFDKDNNYQSIINNRYIYRIKMKVKFHENILEPIFAISVKDFSGLELVGVNTKVYNISTGYCRKNEEIEIEFKQAFPICPGKYTLSFGCTLIDNNGNLEIFDRKYDALVFEVISDKESLGLIHLESDINLIRRKK